MTLDLNKGPIDHTEQQYQDVLQDLQGNILKGHGRNNSVQIFLTFPDTRENRSQLAALRQGIAQFAAEITSAKKQSDDADAWRGKRIDGGVFVHFSLSSSGYEKLGFPDSRQPKGVNLRNRARPNLTNLGNDYADVFQDGMKTRQYALLDSPVSAWEPGFQTEIDALIILAANNETALSNKESEVIQNLKDITTVAAIERSQTKRQKFPNSPKERVLEHFGFVDDIAQPLFLKKDLSKAEATAKKLFSAPLNLVLVPDPLGTENVSFGSFLVFRKLEQNVQGFKKAEAALGQALGISAQQAGAMAVGRFEDGTPLVIEPNAGGTNLNDFDYSDDRVGLKCPFQAHIRKTNPRLESVRKGGPFAQNDAEELGHRIARRGMTYGQFSDFSGDLNNLPTGGVGLLFMCYQSDIWEQFEFIQRFWSNHPRFLEPAMSNAENKNYDRVGLDAVSGHSQPDQRDPVIGEVPQPPKNWIKERDQPTKEVDVNFGNFVTLKGGEYFFSPSISFLKNLPTLPQNFPPPQISQPTPSRTYVVQPSDRGGLFAIAERAYGDGSVFNLIYEANKNVIGPDRNRILPGQILYIPILRENIEPQPGENYIVRPGDFLFLIAERAYQDGNRFLEIYEANRDRIGPDPTVLEPGLEIFIP
ncbi:Dyp-type peroxidase [Phormidesmis sp. 146-35]